MRKEDAVDDRAAIDLSVRTPVLLFFGSSILWLLLASALGAVSALKVNFPDVLPGVSWLTIGRVHPAAGNAFVYGWAGTASIGAALWLMARLCRTPFHFRGTLESVCVLWNLGVTLGVFGILYGQSTSYLALEFPRYASPLIFTAFVLIAFWVGLSFRNRAYGDVYISQWYLLAAFLFFPWTYGTANLLCFFIPVQAPAQAVIAAWYAHSLVSLFFVPIGLAVAYYVIPKVLNVPVANYGLAQTRVLDVAPVCRVERGLQPDRRTDPDVDVEPRHHRERADAAADLRDVPQLPGHAGRTIFGVAPHPVAALR